MIISAYHASADGLAPVIITEDRGHVMVTTPEDETLLAEWIAGGGVIAPYAPPVLPQELSREAFCVALIGAGILTEAEAEAAALGTWPPKFEPALVGKDLVEKLTIKNIWRETKTVDRDAPLFLDLLAFYAAAAGLDAVQAQALGDKIFAAPSV